MRDIMTLFRMTKTLYRTISSVLIMLIITMGFMTTAQAALVTTNDLISVQVIEQSRANLRLLLSRLEVQTQLVSYGVEPSQVLSRVDSMSNHEVQELAALIDSKPAGSGIIGLIGFILVVLLITDLLKLTNVYNI